MKRSFARVWPRVVAAGLGLGGLAVVGVSCNPNNDVKPGAPLLVKLTIAEPSMTSTDVTADTAACDPEAGVMEGTDCDPALTAVCLLETTPCHCQAKAMGDPSIDPANPASGGTEVCTYDPTSTVIATFDRLLDGAPFDKQLLDGGQNTDIVKLDATPKPATLPTIVAVYTSSGIPMAVFSTPGGPNIVLTADPAFPPDSVVSLQLDGTKVRAKDGKTPASGLGPLASGKLSFKTGPLPVPPPPDGGEVDAGTAPDGEALDAGGEDLVPDLSVGTDN
jgi:hypothetical protein